MMKFTLVIIHHCVNHANKIRLKLYCVCKIMIIQQERFLFFGFFWCIIALRYLKYLCSRQSIGSFLHTHLNQWKRVSQLLFLYKECSTVLCNVKMRFKGEMSSSFVVFSLFWISICGQYLPKVRNLLSCFGYSFCC